MSARTRSSIGLKPVVIVGAGPIGLETAVELQRRSIPVRLFDAGSLGHTISWWSPQTRWFSSNQRIAIAGVPLVTIDGQKCSREQYLAYLRGVADQFGIKPECQTAVIDVVPQSPDSDESGDEIDDTHTAEYLVRTKSLQGTKAIAASAVVLAIGGTDTPRKMNIPGEDLPHVDGYLREIHRYYGRRVVVVGGRNSAIEAALRLHHGGARVTLVYRGESLPEKSIKYWLLPEIKGLIESGRIDVHLESHLVKVEPDHVDVKTQTGTQTIACDDVLSLIGYEQDKSLMRRIGVELVGDRQHPQFDESTMETNLPGIYVAGTATAGTQSSSYKVFVENCHVHADRIANHLETRWGKVRPMTESHFADDSLQSLIKIQPES